MEQTGSHRSTVDSAAILTSLLEGRDLPQEQAVALMEAIMAGQVPPFRLAGILATLRAKGETVAEIAGFARAMRNGALRISPGKSGLLDTCGTGGDGSGTFNISTATALVAASMGIPVAKHGNRAVSSRCGSADVLEALGVNLDLEPGRVAALIDEIGIGFLFAPGLHPAMKHAMPVRRELGVRTVFNVLGPLTNPAGADRQLLGVFDPTLCEPLCRVLRELGSQRAFVVHGEGGLDEVSLLGATTVAALEDGKVRTFEFLPAQAGLRTCGPDDLSGGDPAANAAIIKDIFGGKSGPKTDAVLLNAGFAAVLGGLADNVRTGVDLARDAIASGRTADLLAAFAAASQQGVAS
ncbi:MAG: anthranilate phosphoribosyltransferase [Candidatus Krumholzibacteriota bacterium]